MKSEYYSAVEVKYFDDPKPERYESPMSDPNWIWNVPDLDSSAEFVVNVICNKKGSK
jgi:hypothetical protein